jgi:membrane protease YdiL (CAAX protease family)
MPSLKDKTLAVVWAAIISSVISLLGTGIWTALISINLDLTPAIPWAIPAMAIILWLMWQYLGGKWWPRGTAEARRTYLRAHRLPAKVWLWGFLASILALVSLAGLWIVLVELGGTGGNPTIPDTSRYPHLIVILGLLMGSLVSPITEEAGFRGYAQVRLERVFAPAAAIVISSLLFMFWHGPTQGFVWSKLLFYFLVGIVFGTAAFLTNSIQPTIPTHILGDITFFFFIWPHDFTRPLVWRDGADIWFWIHTAQVIIFAGLAVLTFQRLSKMTKYSADKSNAEQVER